MGNEISKEERLKLLFEKEMDCTRRCLKTVCISAFSKAFGNDWFGIFKNDDIEFGRKAKNQGFVIGRGKKNAEYCESFGEFDFQAMVKIIAYRKEKYGDAICKHYNLSKADYQNINNYAIDLLQFRNSKSHENDTKLTPKKMEQGVDRMRSLVYYFPNVLDDKNRNTTFKDEMERAYTEYRKSVATKFFRFDECFYKEIKAYTEEIFLECAEELKFKVVKTPGESGFYSYNVEQDKAALLNAVATKYAEITQKRKSDKIESDNSNIDVSDDKTDDKVGANDAISKADNDTSQITNKINPRYLIIGVLSVCLVLLSSFFISKYYVNRQSEKDSAPLKDYNVTLDSFSLTFSNDVEYSKFNDFGNSGELRQLYTTEDVNKNILGDNIVLNSVVDSKIGDETKFVAAKSIDDTKNTWTSDIINVKDGDVYTVCMYIVNDNPDGLKAIAENVKANLSLPTTVSKDHKIIGYVSASNASCEKYWDTLTLLSEDYFYIEYLEGSAKYTNASMGSIGISPDTILKNGMPVGYDRFDGKIPGGKQYASIVTINIAVHKSVPCKLSVKTRLEGTKTWDEKVEANIGDVIEYQIEFINLLDEALYDVMIRDILPYNIEYIMDSTTFYNSDHQDGAKILDNTLTTSGINLGNYDAKGNAYIRFKAKIVDKDLSTGSNQLVNWANITINDKVLNKDDASVFVNKSSNIK